MGLMEKAAAPSRPRATAPMNKATKEAVVLVRKIVSMPRDTEGNYIQPDENSPDLETRMDKNRMHAANKAQFADGRGCGDGHTYDDTGNNVCGTCNLYLAGKNDCAEIVDIVPGEGGDIDPKASSCRYYENKRAGDWEMVTKRFTKKDALFGTAKNGEGFGCGSDSKRRCGYRKKSKWKDSVGRGEWCGAFAMTTDPTACCAINSTPTIEDSDSDDEDDKEKSEYGGT